MYQKTPECRGGGHVVGGRVVQAGHVGGGGHVGAAVVVGADCEKEPHAHVE